VSPSAQTDSDFLFRPGLAEDTRVAFPFALPSALGPLEPLVGTWHGRGLNTIWRPHFPDSPQDRFLELNLTSEILTFSPIPNRGLLQPDIFMFGLTYMQQIAEFVSGEGLHIEPGIWAAVPETTAPQEPPTVVRMASIPHGTVILAQGTASTAAGPPTIPNNNIIPFKEGQNPAPEYEHAAAEANFPELILSNPSEFREASPGIDQAMVENPNSLLQGVIAQQKIRTTTTLQITTTETPVPGGGTANTAFLGAGKNADASSVAATFWIEAVEDPDGGPDTLQLQYSQTVLLDFKELHWPHVTVATLRKQICPCACVPADSTAAHG